MTYGPNFDVTAVSANMLKSNLRAALAVHGKAADVYDPVPETAEDSPYSEVYPEDTGQRKFVDSTKVVVAENVTGSNISQYISLVDKIEGEYTIISLYDLKEGQHLEIHFSDVKTLTVLILNSEALHGDSTFPYKYYARPL